MNSLPGFASAPGSNRLCSFRSLTALSAALVIGAAVYGSGAMRRDGLPEQVRSGWFRAAVVDADSPGAGRYADREHLPVRLPDSSRAAIATRAGRPQALLLPSSNSLADHRHRALQAGATLDPDHSLVLRAVTDRGQRVDFVMRADGSTSASVPRRDTGPQR